MSLEIRLAETPAERRQVCAIRHAANQSPQPLAAYTARRLSAQRPNRGTWWLGWDGAEAVCTLTLYPLRLGVGPETWAGFGIGGVATLPEHRRRGHASELCRVLTEREQAAGARLGLLFSAIPPGLYEALGFRVLPAHGWRTTRLQELAGSGPRAELRPLCPFREREELVAWHDALHPGLRIARDAGAWERSLQDEPHDLFFATERGYVRVTDEGDESLDVAELLPLDDDAALRAVAELAQALGKRELTSWLPPTPLRERLGEATSRATTLPMLLGEAPADGVQLWGSDYF